MVQMEDRFSLWHAIFYALFQISWTKNISISILTQFHILACVFPGHLYLKTKILDSVKGQTVQNTVFLLKTKPQLIYNMIMSYKIMSVLVNDRCITQGLSLSLSH